jgi:alpha-beta hydrolase superfamily lysophospholipase
MKRLEYRWRNLNSDVVYGQAWQPDSATTAVVCLVHGLGEHSGRYEGLAQVLTDAGVAVFAVDSRGHGRTEGKRGDTPGYRYNLQDVTHLLETAAEHHGDLPKFLYGHSMGGSQVLYHSLCRRRPLAGVIATGPALRPAFEPPRWKLQLAALLGKVLPSLTLGNEVDPEEISSDPAVVAAYKADPLVHDRISARLFNEWRRSVEYIFSHAVEMNYPVLLMHGTNDRLTSPEATVELSERIGKTCTLRLWEGFKHEIHHEPGKQAVFEELIAWIKENSRARPRAGMRQR